MALRNSRPCVNHPDKRAVTKAGLCSACYSRNRRTGTKAVQDIAAIAEDLQARRDEAIAVIDRAKQTVEELIAEAERTLHEALPDAARWLRLAAERAAARGDSRPAETILREVGVTGTDGKTKRRLLEPPARQYEHGSTGATGPQIIVGVNIGGTPARLTSGSECAASEPAIGIETLSVPVVCQIPDTTSG